MPLGVFQVITFPTQGESLHNVVEKDAFSSLLQGHCPWDNNMISFYMAQLQHVA